jgi:hypothetical protein
VKVTHRVVCAVVICNTDYQWVNDTANKDVTNLHLMENGWHLEYGTWICPAHPENKAVNVIEDSSTFTVPVHYFGALIGTSEITISATVRFDPDVSEGLQKEVVEELRKRMTELASRST